MLVRRPVCLTYDNHNNYSHHRNNCFVPWRIIIMDGDCCLCDHLLLQSPSNGPHIPSSLDPATLSGDEILLLNVKWFSSVCWTLKAGHLLHPQLRMYLSLWHQQKFHWNLRGRRCINFFIARFEADITEGEEKEAVWWKCRVLALWPPVASDTASVHKHLSSSS